MIIRPLGRPAANATVWPSGPKTGTPTELYSPADLDAVELDPARARAHFLASFVACSPPFRM